MKLVAAVIVSLGVATVSGCQDSPSSPPAEAGLDQLDRGANDPPAAVEPEVWIDAELDDVLCQVRGVCGVHVLPDPEEGRLYLRWDKHPGKQSPTETILLRLGDANGHVMHEVRVTLDMRLTQPVYVTAPAHILPYVRTAGAEFGF